MATSFNKENDEIAIALLQKLIGMGIEVDLETRDEAYGVGRRLVRTARVEWQTHNADASPFKRR